MDLTTDQGIESYLSNNGYSCKSVKQLSGGNANFVWRVDLTEDSSKRLEGEHETELIVKHAEQYGKDFQQVALPLVRMDFEARVMRMVPDVIGAKPSSGSQHGLQVPGLEVYTPRIYHFDGDAYVLAMSSGGNVTLKDAYAQLSGPQIHSIGKRLARWLAHFHACTKTTDIGEDGNAVGKALYRHSYNQLHYTLAGHGLGGENGNLGKVVNEQYGALLATDNDCVAHGDFWTGNIIMDASNLPSDDKSPPALTIVDWELTRRGNGATDVGQFVAEAYLLDRFRDSHYGLAGVFLRSYLEATNPGQEFIDRVGIHLGVHLAFWPNFVSWGNKKETKELAELGVRIMEMAMASQQGWLEILMAELDKFATDA